MEPLVSVIIPTYNRAHLIRRTLDSVIKQSYRNLEIIIVDDASTDNTEEVIKIIADPRIRYIRHPTNYGGGTARNTGIKAVTGKYVTFLDSDDQWLPNKIELQLRSLKNCEQGEKAVSYTQFTSQNSYQVSILPGRGKIDTEPVADYLFVNGGEILTSTLMLPRTLALSTLFRPDLKKHQDVDLYLRLEKNGALFSFLNQPLTLWDNDLDTERISNLSDYKFSLNWIREYESEISTQATKGFLIKEVVRQLIESEQQPLYALQLIIDAAWHGVISFQRCGFLMSKVMLPNSRRKQVKKFLKWDRKQIKN